MLITDNGSAIRDINDISPDQLLVIQRKQCGSKILVKCHSVTNDNEVILSVGKNDYFNFDMYLDGKSWVCRVWVLGKDVKITSITNNINEFPR